MIEICHEDDNDTMHQPQNSKITFTGDGDHLRFVIPPVGLRQITLFWLLMAVIWFGILAGAIAGGAPFLALVVVGLPALAATYAFLYFLLRKLEITVDQDTLTFQRSLFGQVRTKTRNLKHLTDIDKVLLYKLKYRRVYGVGLYFKKGRRIRFGSNLSEEDQDWLISVFTALKNKR
ncbi:MAG: hypothetical protein AAGB22_10705 [Bacteroidota bacterium]